MKEQQIRYAEIVKDYADKTLSFGCVMRKENTIGFYTERKTNNNEYEVKRKNKGYIYLQNPEILGHIFDLSCVLRYIEDNVENIGGEIADTSIGDDFYFYVAIGYSNTENGEELMDEMDIFFPNKPILTYTEQELEQLNNNLEKLG